MGKYDPLRDHLENLEGDEWRTSFPGVEKILGFPLPKSAREHQAWWANEKSPQPVQKIAWIKAGWITENLNLTGETVTFVRSSHAATKRSEHPLIRKTVERVRNFEELNPQAAGGIDPVKIMSHLGQERPVFHSEADFQHALAWTVHKLYPDAKIRLEYRPPNFGRHYVDVWIANDGQIVAVELKYWTRRLNLAVDGEEFFLQNQGAQDLSRYDLLKDLQRLEKVVAAIPNCTGWAIALTNDGSYWRPARSNTTVDVNFRLHEEREFGGTLDWAAHTGAGTKKGRNEPIELGNRYKTNWWRYSEPAKGNYGQFRGLMFQVG